MHTAVELGHDAFEGRELEQAVVELVHGIYGGHLLSTPDWLMRPGPAECGRRWLTLKAIYRELTGLEVPDEMPPVNGEPSMR